MKPEWFDKLSPREQRKQINRWKYYRQYYRRKYGSNWEWHVAAQLGLL